MGRGRLEGEGQIWVIPYGKAGPGNCSPGSHESHQLNALKSMVVRWEVWNVMQVIIHFSNKASDIALWVNEEQW